MRRFFGFRKIRKYRIRNAQNVPLEMPRALDSFGKVTTAGWKLFPNFSVGLYGSTNLMLIHPIVSRGLYSHHKDSEGRSYMSAMSAGKNIRS